MTILKHRSLQIPLVVTTLSLALISSFFLYAWGAPLLAMIGPVFRGGRTSEIHMICINCLNVYPMNASTQAWSKSYCHMNISPDWSLYHAGNTLQMESPLTKSYQIAAKHMDDPGKSQAMHNPFCALSSEGTAEP